jgi:hypothetical protein
VTEAAELSEAADTALCAQQSVRAVLGSDVRSALDRLEIVDSALATLRRREIATWSSEPREYVVALLGPRPSDAGRAQRWQQGTVEIEDWRRSRGCNRWRRFAERLDACARPAERGLGGPKATARRREPRCGATRPRSRGDRSCSGRERRSFARPGDDRGARARQKRRVTVSPSGAGMVRSSGGEGEVRSRGSRGLTDLAQAE